AASRGAGDEDALVEQHAPPVAHDVDGRADRAAADRRLLERDPFGNLREPLLLRGHELGVASGNLLAEEHAFLAERGPPAAAEIAAAADRKSTRLNSSHG